MGRIRIPPKDIIYPLPTALGPGKSSARVLGRAMVMESFPGWGDYMRVLDLVEFRKNTLSPRHRELRFCQFYRKPGGGDADWIFGQCAGHMSIATFYELLRRAQEAPDCGSFGRAFNKLEMKGRKR
ncbi:MAG TPA: hypothetical protein VMT56_00755 [Candidatus Bathyarchaeia archaeon]|nr:hypothetical protein [Candidatus Bathyarchaeia archaeon]